MTQRNVKPNNIHLSKCKPFGGKSGSFKLWSLFTSCESCDELVIDPLDFVLDPCCDDEDDKEDVDCDCWLGIMWRVICKCQKFVYWSNGSVSWFIVTRGIKSKMQLIIDAVSMAKNPIDLKVSIRKRRRKKFFFFSLLQKLISLMAYLMPLLFALLVTKRIINATDQSKMRRKSPKPTPKILADILL